MQAETEELAVKVQALTAENLTLKSEVNKLMESSEKLKLQNAALMVYISFFSRLNFFSICLYSR